MKKKYRFKLEFRMVALMAALCLSFAGCGSSANEDAPYTIGGAEAGDAVQEGAEATAEPTTIPQNPVTGEISESTATAIWEAELAEELAEKGYSEAEESMDSREHITLGIFYNFYKTDIKSTVLNFNIYQDKYWMDVKEYDEYSNVLADIMRGTGADVFYLNNMPFELFADKGVLEDLTPYFEESEVISKEQIVPSIWRAGSVDDKYVGVIPGFNTSMYLVEKSVTENGSWTLDDYFALGDKYPASKLEEHVQDPSYYFVNFLNAALQSFVNWEEMTCNFDSEGFRNLLSKMKENAEKEYESKGAVSAAEKLYEKEYLVSRVSLSTGYDPVMSNYIILKDTFLKDYDLVGIPNAQDIPMYELYYREMYGVNANSENKAAAWAFIEYLLSEEYQSDLDFSMFTARMDMMEEILESEISYEFKWDYFTTNRFTGEKIKLNDLSDFTAEDKEQFLFVVENAYRNNMRDSEIYYIVEEEVDFYFAGDKSLDEVVKLIQNRCSLYLDECKN